MNSSPGTLIDLWKTEIVDTIPRAITFYERNESVLIFGLENGEM